MKNFSLSKHNNNPETISITHQKMNKGQINNGLPYVANEDIINNFQGLRLISASTRNLRSLDRPSYEATLIWTENDYSISSIITPPNGMSINDAIMVISYLSNNLRNAEVSPSTYIYYLTKSLAYYGFHFDQQQTNIKTYNKNEPTEIAPIENVLDLIRITGESKLIEKSMPTLLQRHFNWLDKGVSEDKFIEIYTRSGNQNKLKNRAKVKPELFEPMLSQKSLDQNNHIIEYSSNVDEKIIL